MPAVIVDDIPSDLPTVEWEVESLMRKEGCGPLFVLRTSFFARQDSELGTTNRAAAITSQFQSAKFNFSGSLFGECLRSSRRPLLPLATQSMSGSSLAVSRPSSAIGARRSAFCPGGLTLPTLSGKMTSSNRLAPNSLIAAKAQCIQALSAASTA